MNDSNHDPSTLPYTPFPESMRTVERRFATGAFLACLAANATLVTLAATTRVAGIRAYRRVILINCAVDVVGTLTMHFFKLQMDLSHGYLAIIIDNSFFAQTTIGWHFVFAFIYFVAGACTMHITAMMFYFRYSLVCRSEIISTRQLIKSTSILLAYTIGECAMLVYSMYETTSKSARADVCRRVMRSPIWSDVDRCIFTNAESVYYIIFLASGIFIHSFVYAVMVGCAYCVWRDLRRQRQQFSVRTRRLHRQMNGMLAAQMAAPLFTVFLPSANFLVFPIFRLSLPGVGLTLTLLLACIPLSNPIITIAFIGPFRQAIVRAFGVVLPYRWLSVRRASMSTATVNCDTSAMAPQSPSVNRNDIKSNRNDIKLNRNDINIQRK